MFFKPNLSAVHLGFWYFVHGSLSKNITAVHLGFSNFVDGSLSENLTAVHLAFSNFMHGGLSENATAVHLGFSNFVHGSRSENLTAVHLAFLNFMHGSLFGNPTAVHLGFLNFIQSSVFENLTAVHLGFSNITYGCPSCRNGVKLPQSYGKWMHLQRNITHECLMNQSVSIFEWINISEDRKDCVITSESLDTNYFHKFRTKKNLCTFLSSTSHRLRGRQN